METWADIPSYAGLYQASTEGRIRSLPRKFSPSLNVLKPIKDSYGYRLVNLHKGKEMKTVKIHRLIALTFIANPENKPEVNHINGVKTDNAVLNLEWVTTQENQTHTYEHLGRINDGGVQPLAVPVEGVSLDGKEIIQFPSRRAALSKGFHPYSISKCLAGEYRQHKGYTWRVAA